MQIFVLRNSNGSFRGKLHSHDSYDCKGRRMYEETYPDKEDYVLTALSELPERQPACQFCFEGLADAAAVKDRYPVGAQARSPARVAMPAAPARGIQIGHTIRVRDLETNENRTWVLVPKPEASPADGRLSIESPIARALQGRDTGDTITVITPGGQRRYIIEDTGK